MTQIKVFKGLPSVSDERYIDEFGNEQIQSITQTIVMYEILGSTSDDYYPRRPEISI